MKPRLCAAHRACRRSMIGSGSFLERRRSSQCSGPRSVRSASCGALIICDMLGCLGRARRGERRVAARLAGPTDRQFIAPAERAASAGLTGVTGWRCADRNDRGRRDRWTTWSWRGQGSGSRLSGLLITADQPALPEGLWQGRVLAVAHQDRCNPAVRLLALAIALGLVGEDPPVGTSSLLAEGGFGSPHGYRAVLITMVLVLVNFQGAEIIGLTAGQSEDPTRSIAIAHSRNVTWRIIALYVVPLALLVTIFPWQLAGVEQSVFAALWTVTACTGRAASFRLSS